MANRIDTSPINIGILSTIPVLIEDPALADHSFLYLGLLRSAPAEKTRFAPQTSDGLATTDCTNSQS
jgi:hypothetical protein